MKQILIKPVITEKSSNLQETANKYTFIVAKDANKIEVRTAIEQKFKVKVASVATMNYEGKEKRVGKYLGRKNDFKKAVVTLLKDEKIEFQDETV